jgi:hypothetical protein
LNVSNPGQSGERLHFRARPRRRPGAIDQEDRKARAPPKIEELIAGRERVETAGDEAHRRKSRARRASDGELLT